MVATASPGTAPTASGQRVAGQGRIRWAGLSLVVPLLLAALVVWGTAIRQPQPGPEDPVRWLAAGDKAASVRLQGRLRTDPVPLKEPAKANASDQGRVEAKDGVKDGVTDETAPGCRVLLDSDGGASELIFSRCPTLQEGWQVRVTGTLTRPRPAPHPLLASARERLGRQGVWSQLRVEQFSVLQRPATPIADLRRRIAATFLRQAGPNQGGLLAALVLGSAVVPLPSELRDDFRVAGLSHALAASGFHLTVLLGAVLALAKPLGRRLRLPLAALAIGLFLLLAGPQPSVVRAVLTGAVALVALEFGRRSRPLPWLVTAAAVMVLVRPDWLQDVGFQLSVAATAGLLVSANSLEQALLGGRVSRAQGAKEVAADEVAADMDAKTSAGKGGSWLRRWLAAAVAVPLAATLWTLPLQVLHFGVVPLWAVPANVLAAPLLTPLTLGSMAVALLDLVAPPLTGVLLGPLGALAGLLLQLAHGFAQLPMAQWQTGRPQPWLVLGLALGLLGWLVPGLRRRWRLLASGLLVLVVSIHVASLRADALMLVRDGTADLLVARHQGRAALVASSADGFSCRRAARLAAGLGSPRYDWVLSLDPLASPEPHCWRTLAPLVLLSGDDSAPLGPGQRLRSAGLAVEALSAESNALQLQFGGQRWLLLPDRGSLQAWRHSPKASNLAGLWLGFQPHAGERRWLEAQTPRRVWISGRSPAAAPLPKGWQSSGNRGSLVTAGP
ncbi:MAG: ComEC/Rec2 family competence protein [Cyanobacteriota bacterium]